MTEPEFVAPSVLDDLAEAFVAGMGRANREFLAENLRYTADASEALRSLKGALARFYVRRPEFQELR